ncbi:MAG: isopropylmalate isomerase [Acidobacteria bacterium]|nr:isopropylmalate isomerase [Acidobacteriota bacterium]
MTSRIDEIRGRALPLRGDDIDTDRIIPARYLRSTSFEGLDAHVFEDDRRSASGLHPFANPAFAGARVLVVNRNFGCGSSREHAPQALYRWGIRALVGQSFSEIFQGNATMIGLPCLAADPKVIETIMQMVEARPETVVTLGVSTLAVSADDQVFGATLGPAIREALLSGAWDPTTLLLDRYEDVQRVAERLPYLKGFAGNEERRVGGQFGVKPC